MKTCPKCQDLHSKPGTFCSRSCANSRGPMSDADKELRRKWVKEHPNIVIKNRRYGKYPNKHVTVNCPTCQNDFETYKSNPKVFCSVKCVRLGGYRKESYRHGIKGYYQGIHCDSTWELAFLIYHLDHHHNITRNSTALTYINEEDKERKYYPDFIIDQVCYEIKGILTETDKLKLKYNPSVKLITENELKPIFSYIKSKYNTPLNKIKSLYDNIDYSGIPDRS